MKLSRDLLTIQATSVSQKRLFSRAGLMIRKHRNRLHDESVPACISLNTWVNCSLTATIRYRPQNKKQLS